RCYPGVTPPTMVDPSWARRVEGATDACTCSALPVRDRRRHAPGLDVGRAADAALTAAWPALGLGVVRPSVDLVGAPLSSRYAARHEEAGAVPAKEGDGRSQAAREAVPDRGPVRRRHDGGRASGSGRGAATDPRAAEGCRAARSAGRVPVQA